MTRNDYSDYESRRAVNHEMAWRMIATICNIRSRNCRFRQCRRRQFCSGPMLPSEHQKGAVKAQQAIGLSGQACADLPGCTAEITPALYAHMRRMCEMLAEQIDLNPDQPAVWLLLKRLRRDMSRQSRATRTSPAHLTSPARQPTSGTKQEG